MSSDPHAFDRAKALAASLDFEEAARDSFHNFHVAGLDYVCLFRSPRYTAKLYFIGPDVPHNDDGFLVNPHSHGYAFRQTVLDGMLEHFRFTQDAYSRESWCEAEYRSPLATGEDGAGLRWVHLDSRWDKTKETYRRGGGYFLATDEVHTIRVPFGAVLFTEQYADAGLPHTTYLSQQPVEPDLSGLYVPMQPGEVAELVTGLFPSLSAERASTEAPV